MQLDANGTASILPGDVDDGSSDACGIATKTVTPNSFSCTNVGTNTVTLTVSDVNGNSSTAAATVTVLVTPPAIATQPSTITKCLGEAASFSVTTTGTVLSYQWRKDNANITGATAASLTIPTVGMADAGSYDVVLSGICATTVPSEAATLTVIPQVVAAGTISGPVVVCAGTTGSTYSIAPVSGATQYDWTLPTGATIVSGIGTSSITVDWGETAVSGDISVLPRNDCFTGTANTIAVTVNTTPFFTLHPQDQIVLSGGSTTFSVSVIGQPNPTIQWQMRTATSPTWVPVLGATGTSVTISNLVMARQGEQYRVEATNSCGVAYSDEATVTIKLQLADLGPIEFFAGVTDNIYNNRNIDVLVELYKNSTLIGSQAKLDQKVSGNAQNSSKRFTVPLVLHDASFLATDELHCKVYIRKADNGGNIGIQFWYNDNPLPSINQGNKGYARITKVTVSNTVYDYYYLRGGSSLFLCTSPGSSGMYIQRSVGSTYQHVGTWSILGSQMKRMDDARADELLLYQNYPNPFNTVTAMSFSLPEEMTIRLSILDALGREVEVLSQGPVVPGYYSRTWTAPPQLPAGTYSIRLVGRKPDGSETVSDRRIILLR